MLYIHIVHVHIISSHATCISTTNGTCISTTHAFTCISFLFLQITRRYAEFSAALVSVNQSEPQDQVSYACFIIDNNIKLRSFVLTDYIIMLNKSLLFFTISSIG